MLHFDDPGLRENPYPAYRMLREWAPLWRAPPVGPLLLPTGESEAGPPWLLSPHAEVGAVLRDSRFGHDNIGQLDADALAEPVYQWLTRTMLFLDPPAHTRLRGLVVRAFTARRVEALRDRIAAIVDALIDTVIDRGEMDLVADFAHKLPVIVICDMLGVPEADRHYFLHETIVRGRVLDPVPLTRQEFDEANASVAELDAYFAKLFTYRREHPGDDLTTALLAAREADDRLSDEEVLSNIGLLFAAGHETTSNLIGNGMLALHRHPAELARLRADLSLVPNAVEELLRYDSPVQLTGRRALEDVDILGQTIRQGEEVILLLGGANHDPAAYAGDPDTLDVARPGVRAISFGGGIHHCLGAQLARIEGAIAFRRLLERLPALRLAEPDRVEWKPTITLRGPKTLRAVW